jgi:hypothetical protein
MITMALRARSVSRNASARKPATRAPILVAVARAFRVVPEPYPYSVTTSPGRRPSVPSFIAYDVLDVIGGRRVN